MQQGEDGRHQVNLGAKLLHPPRLDEARGIDDRRYVVLVHRDAGLAGAGGAVVGHDDEHGVAEPRSARGLGEELADGEIGVLHGGGARLHLTVVGDLPFRECVRTMIADCEYDGVERSPALGLLVELLQGHPVRILVAGTPDVAERYVLLRITVLVDDLEAVAGEVGAHVVEIAVAAVDERGRVAVLPQHGAGGEKSGVVRPFDKAFAGARRNAEGQGLKAADGPVAGGVEVVEDKALFNERVQIRSDAVLIAIGGEEIGAQALDGDHHDVLPDRRNGVPYHPHGGIGRLVCLPDRGASLLSDRNLAAKREFESLRLILGKHLIEPVIFKSAAAVGLKEIPASVALQLGRVVIGALEVTVAETQPEEASGEQHRIDDECRQERNGSPVAGLAEILPPEQPPTDQHRHKKDSEEHRHDRI